MVRLGWRARNRRKELFDAYFPQIRPEEFFFVQIGAGDGRLADPIYPYVLRHKLRGLALEPLPVAFERLKQTYRMQPQVRCLNVAIAERDGQMTLYAPASDDAALSTLASLDRGVLEKTLRAQHNGAGVGIAAHTVRALSFDTLAAQERVERIDLLQIDCEGYDWKLLKTVDLEKWKPAIINFESALLSPAALAESRRHLEKRGYSWFEQGLDTCAYKI